MRTVWKFPFQPNSIEGGAYEIVIPAVPKGARPLCVMAQHGVVCLWAEVDPKATKGSLSLYCVGTGFGAVPEGKVYIGSVIDEGLPGNYVWHLYY